MPSLYSRLLLLGALIAFLDTGLSALAQTDYTWIGTDGDYEDGNNWDFGFPPLGEFDERATINVGTARVSSFATQPGQVTLAGPVGSAASLIIESTGNLALYNDEILGPGLTSSLGIDVGVGGTGTLVVKPGGTLSSANIIVRGVGSSVTLDGSGLSPATVTIGTTIPGKASGTNVFGGNSFRVKGPNVNYSTNNFDVEPGGIFISEITGPNHATITAPNGVIADGILRVELNGYSPTTSNTWNLFDAPSVSGRFSSIEATGASLPIGQKFTFQEVPNGSLGVYGQLGIEQQLVLKVNRDTGLMTIATGTQAVTLDGYVIRSQLGGINAANWNSLDDQGVSDWRESPLGGSSNLVAELKPTGSTSITSGTPRALGNIFKLPTPTKFGTEIEDIEFEYYRPDGSVVNADVIYEGQKRYNNLVLVVDPVDGDAILQNQSTLSVEIEGYVVHSDSESLLPTNSNWLSLDDQGTATWRESNPTTSNLAELLPTGEALISGGATINLGSPFRTELAGGTEDLTFRYLLPGDSEFTEGIVVYRDVDFQQLDGDFDRDGDVDGRDFLAWQRGQSPQPMSAGDLAAWKANYGVGGIAAVTAIPEPHALAMGVLMGATLLMRRAASRS